MKETSEKTLAERERNALWRWICMFGRHADDCKRLHNGDEECSCPLGEVVGKEGTEPWGLRRKWVEKCDNDRPEFWPFKREDDVAQLKQEN